MQHFQQETLRAKAALTAARDGPLDDYEMLDETTKGGNKYTTPAPPFRSNSYVEVVEKHMLPKPYHADGDSSGGSAYDEPGTSSSRSDSVGEENDAYDNTAL